MGNRQWRTSTGAHLPKVLNLDEQQADSKCRFRRIGSSQRVRPEELGGHRRLIWCKTTNFSRDSVDSTASKSTRAAFSPPSVITMPSVVSSFSMINKRPIDHEYSGIYKESHRMQRLATNLKRNSGCAQLLQWHWNFQFGETSTPEKCARKVVWIS